MGFQLLLKTGAAVYCASERSASAIVPGSPKKTSESADEHGHGAPTRMNWARLLKRVFDIDPERCPHCGGGFNRERGFHQRLVFDYPLVSP